MGAPEPSREVGDHYLEWELSDSWGEDIEVASGRGCEVTMTLPDGHSLLTFVAADARRLAAILNAAADFGDSAEAAR